MSENWYIVKASNGRKYEYETYGEKMVKMMFSYHHPELEIVEIVPAVHYQSFGRCEAKPISEFRPGDFMVYNYGGVARFERVVKETAKSVTIEILDPGIENDWSRAKVYTQRKNKSTLWGFIGEDYVRASTKNYDCVC